MEALPLEGYAEKENSENNIYAVSTDDAKKASSENVESLPTEDDSKYANSKNIAPVPNEEDVEEARSEFDICNTHFQGRMDFCPKRLSQICCTNALS